MNECRQMVVPKTPSPGETAAAAAAAMLRCFLEGYCSAEKQEVSKQWARRANINCALV